MDDGMESYPIVKVSYQDDRKTNRPTNQLAF